MGKMEVIAEPGKQEIIMTRIFDAPRELVYTVYTDPKHIPQWWGAADYQTVVDAMEVKPGGRWRYVQRGADGMEFAFHGFYHLVEDGTQLVHTIEFEGTPGHVGLETIQFETLPDGRTKLIDRGVFQTVEARDAMLSSGMEEGANATWDRFEALLKEMATA